MTLLTQMLAGGTFVCVIVLGVALARGLGYRRPASALAMSVPLGVAAMSVPLMVCAMLGAFHAALIGAVAWCVTVITTVSIGFRAKVRFPRRTNWKCYAKPALIMLIGVASFLYLGYPAESPLGSRDEGLYSLGGLALDRAGTLVIPRPGALGQAPALFAPFFQGMDFFLTGVLEGPALRPQFSPVLPAWIAQLHAVGGDRWLYRINALFALGALAVFNRLARLRLRPGFALLATAAFAFNPAQVWISRVNLAEPLGQLLGLGGIVLGLDALRTRSNPRIFAAAALFAMSSAVRLDMVIVSSLLLAAAFAVRLWGPRVPEEDARMPLRLALTTLGGQVFAIAGLALWSPAYVDYNLVPSILPLSATLIFVPGYFAVRYGAFEWLRSPTIRKRLATGFIATLCVAFAYAALIRPHLTPFALIQNDSHNAGLRDYREESLRNLAAYLGWPTLLFALAGAAVATARVVAGRATASATVLVVLAIGTATVILAAPEVSPDHFWAIRRFITLVIPLIVLMSAWGIQSTAAAIGWRYRASMPILVIVTAASMLWAQRSTLFVKENAGLTAQLRALDATLPPGPLVVRDLEALATTFALGFGREVLPLRDEHVPVDSAAQVFWRSCANIGCTLLHTSFDGLRGLQTGPSRVVSLTRRYIAPTYKPLAHEIAQETTDLFVTPILGLDTTAPPRNTGAVRDWRLQDHGLYRDEFGAAGDARWTDGDADLTLPTWRADELQLRLANGADRPSDVRIDLDGHRLFEGQVPPGARTLDFPIAADAPQPKEISIRSSEFVPKTFGINADTRRLGISIRAIRLIDDHPPAMTPSSPKDAYRCAISVPGGIGRLPQELGRTRTALPLTVDVENRGNVVWPALGEVRPGASHVALGIYWTHPGQSQRLLEQRVQLPYSLRPSESLRLGVPLDPRSPPLTSLRDGDYEVTVGLVYDGVAWFADQGGQVIRFPVKIVQ